MADSGSSPHSEPGKHWLESGSPTSRMSVLTTKLGWSSSSCFTPPWIWWHFYWNRYICVKGKKNQHKAPNSGTTLIRKTTSGYLESARIWIYSPILKKTLCLPSLKDPISKYKTGLFCSKRMGLVQWNDGNTSIAHFRMLCRTYWAAACAGGQRKRWCKRFQLNIGCPKTFPVMEKTL